MEIKKKKLPVGVEFFKDFQRDDFYYVDKTAFIRTLLEYRGVVNLFTRPRRFGKSLNMDMLKAFFEIGADPLLFEGLEICNEKNLVKQYMGKYPVISITLKDINGISYKDSLKKMSRVIRREARRHQYLMDSPQLTEIDKKSLQRLYLEYLDEDIQEESLSLLSEMLCKHYRKPVIILIDEYDVPLDKAYQKGYYSEMTEHIRALFSEALKSNENLYFAVITGCLRIAKESIFTGLNNFKVRTISDIRYAQYFGFTNLEVKKMLSYYEIDDKFDSFKEWYDGYRFGLIDIYCPWDVINQCDLFLESKDAPMQPHWENSSSNAIVQNILETATETTKAEIGALISGDCVEKILIPELTYTDLQSKDIQLRQTYLWSVLFAAGYLTETEKTQNGLHRLIIPNREVHDIYVKKIGVWFREKVTSNTSIWQSFCQAMKKGDAKQVQSLFNTFMSDSISIRDTYIRKDRKENFYHDMLLGLLRAEGGWIVKSNAEAGIGYADIQIEIPTEKIGCVIEVKYAENEKYDAACLEAIMQIETSGYTEELKKEGMEIIHKYGIACCKKTCKIMYKREEKADKL